MTVLVLLGIAAIFAEEAWLARIPVIGERIVAVMRSPARNVDLDLSGTVTHVRDGDTIEVNGVAVRLSRLDAAELDEDGGREARRAMVRLVEGKQVRCRLTGERSYDREIGACFIDGEDVAELMRRAGHDQDCVRSRCGRAIEGLVDALRERLKTGAGPD